MNNIDKIFYSNKDINKDTRVDYSLYLKFLKKVCDVQVVRRHVEKLSGNNTVKGEIQEESR